MAGEAARRLLFDTINEVNNNNDGFEECRVWTHIFNLYGNNDFENYRLTATNTTSNEIAILRRFIAGTRMCNASAGRETWRMLLSGIVYFRVDILPVIAEVLDLSVDNLLNALLNYEENTYINSRELFGSYYLNSSTITNDCNHYWWRIQGSDLWDNEEVDIRKEYTLGD